MNKALSKSSDLILSRLQSDYFLARKLDAKVKFEMLSKIAEEILKNAQILEEIVHKEIKLTKIDAKKETDRAYKTFLKGAENVSFQTTSTTRVGNIKIIERRIPRGPLLAITPFSSPLSSPSHKIVMGILTGTSVLFKPSRDAILSGTALFEIINRATNGKYVYLLNTDIKELSKVVADERIGIISFTGGFSTGKNIIQHGGVKRYHMELSGGNSSVVFDKGYSNYNDELLDKLIEAIVAKSGQRCVSLKHIFIPAEHMDFVNKIHTRLLGIRTGINNQKQRDVNSTLGPLIDRAYVRKTESKVNEILANFSKIRPVLGFETSGSLMMPCIYLCQSFSVKDITQMLDYELPGPVVFIHTYKSTKEFNNMINAFKKDYIRAGLQLSIFTDDELSFMKYIDDIYWGGIILNNIPTFRDDTMSFGGFGRAGLGKEGFFETFNQYTDPQTIVIPS